LNGLLSYDSRDPSKSPSTVIASRGIIVSTDTGQQVLVFDGSRQDYDKNAKILKRLDFDQYTIDLPEPGPARTRWREPEERTFGELFSPDLKDETDRRYRREFIVEIHKRIVTPFLVPAYTVIGLCALLLGPLHRRGQGRRIFAAIGAVIVIQALFLASYNLAKQSGVGVPLMYLITMLPLAGGLLLLARASGAMEGGRAST
jgi:lipopolysaccharide export system permease protein